MTVGHFHNHELRVTDVEAGAAFYAELFGWTVTSTPFGHAFQVGDVPVASVSEVKPGIPPHWTSHLGVEDVPATVERAKQHGGIVTLPGGEAVNIPGVGWMAVILDPTNKVVFVATKPQPYPAEPLLGKVIWSRLYAADVEAAAEFYTDVLPWTLVRHADGSPGGLRAPEDVSVADLVPAGDRPPHWLPYVLVADLEAARAKAVSLGATVLVEREEFPGDSGLGAVIVDPEGVETGLCQVL